MKMSIRNRLLLGGIVVATIKPSSDKLLAWLAIYPITPDALKLPDLKDELRTECSNVDKYIYRIYQFELPAEYVENDWDFSEDTMVNRNGVIVCSLDDVERVLAERGIPSDNLTEPWKTDYPL